MAEENERRCPVCGKGVLRHLGSEEADRMQRPESPIVETYTCGHEVTTPPLVVMHQQTPILVVGTDNGLWAMSVPELKVLGVIRADDDSVRGALAAADVDGDGAPEIAMVTKRGRVALVNTTDGNVRWSVEGATDAASATFADVNGDGVLDVIVAGGSDFALGFSGRDGSLVMKVKEGGRAGAAEKSNGSLRSLVVAPSLGGGGMLVGGDPARVGLRAVELPKGSVKTASKRLGSSTANGKRSSASPRLNSITGIRPWILGAFQKSFSVTVKYAISSVVSVLARVRRWTS